MKNKLSLEELYTKFIERQLSTKNELIKIIWYEDKNGRHCEYPEWYWFRDRAFEYKVEEKITNPYFKWVFYVSHMALNSSNNKDNFIKLLEDFLSNFIINHISKNNKKLSFDEKILLKTVLPIALKIEEKKDYFIQLINFNKVSFSSYINDNHHRNLPLIIIEELAEKVKKIIWQINKKWVKNFINEYVIIYD